MSLPQKKVNALIVFSGDFSGAFDVTGTFDNLIKADANKFESSQLPETKNPENCTVLAQFSDVMTKFTQKNEPAYKIFFQFVCDDESGGGKKRTTQTPAFFIRKDSLQGPTNTIHLSEKTRSTQFRIKEISASE